MSWIVTLLTRLLRSVHAKPALALIACLLGLFLGRTWLSSHDASVRLGATMAVQKRVSAEANQRERARDKSMASVLSGIRAEKQRVNTPAKAAAAIPKALPPLPEPITLTIPDRQDTHPTVGASGGGTGCTPPSGSRLLLYDDGLGGCANLTKSVPPRLSQAPAQSYIAPSDAQGDNQPPAIASIPQSDLKPIYDFLEVRAITAERDAAIKAAGKGSFWSRLSHNSKWFALGAATAATLAATQNF